jgi:hypothetical protein
VLFSKPKKITDYQAKPGWCDTDLQEVLNNLAMTLPTIDYSKRGTSKEKATVGPSFDKELEGPDTVHDTVAAAKRYLQNDLPVRIKYVSFVLHTDEPYWESWRLVTNKAK